MRQPIRIPERGPFRSYMKKINFQINSLYDCLIDELS